MSWSRGTDDEGEFEHKKLEHCLSDDNANTNNSFLAWHFDLIDIFDQKCCFGAHRVGNENDMENADVEGTEQETNNGRDERVAIDADDLDVGAVSSQELEEEGEEDREPKPLDIHEPKRRPNHPEVILERILGLIINNIVDCPQAEDYGGDYPEGPVAE